MRIFTKHSTALRQTAGKLVLAASLATVFGGAMIGPAFADNDDWRRGGHERDRYEHNRHDRDRHEREWRARSYFVPGYAYAPPTVVYAAPPAVVYAPPPRVYYAPPVSPSVNFVFPLNVR